MRDEAACDVLVVGAGPAGSTAAALFAAAGFEVRLVERQTFPRFKPCGDFLSPEGTRVLQRLGVEDEVRRAGARPLRGLLVSAYGEPALRADFEPGERATGYALPRERLDAILLGAARRAGAAVFEGTAVEGLCGNSVHVRTVSGESRVWRARLLLGAGGRSCPVARGLGVRPRVAEPRRVDLLAHWDGLDASRPYCEMHVFGPGYTGIAAVGPDRVNVNTVVPASWVRRRAAEGNGALRPEAGRERRRRLYLRLLRACPAVRRVVEDGRELHSPIASDVTPFTAARASAAGVLLMGDAALFLDPFTGQGIYLALRSAELAFEVGCEALRAGDTSRVRLAAYDAIRRAEFAPKVRLSRLLQGILYRPWLARRVAAALRRDRLGARRLIGVVGDYLPAAELLRPDFLGRLAAAGLL